MSPEQNLMKLRARTGGILLLAMSKGHPAGMIARLYHAGQRDFGENYVQEALQKMEQLSDLHDICWHMTGPVQSNKTRQVATHFHWLHTLDKEKTAVRLQAQRPDVLPPLNVCLQVNISRVPGRAGIRPEFAEVAAMTARVMALPRLCVRGLMAVPQARDLALREERDRVREEFRHLHRLFVQLQQEFAQAQIDTLSAGMSADMDIAMEEGSTCVRAGTALFGARKNTGKL